MSRLRDKTEEEKKRYGGIRVTRISFSTHLLTVVHVRQRTMQQHLGSSFNSFRLLYSRRIALLSTLHSLIYIFSLFALSASSIAIFQIVKTSELFWTLLFSFLILAKRPKQKEYVLVTMIVFSSVLSCSKSTAVSLLEIVYGIFAAVTSARNVYTKSVLQSADVSVSKSEIILSYGFYSFVLALVIVIVFPQFLNSQIYL
ncbi:hypothetical protein P9112_001549 [Eukaryota sp. TZLM1-RC]